MNPDNFNTRAGCRSLRAGTTSGAGVVRPRFDSVTLADGLQWRGGGGFRFEEKLDGVWHIRETENAILAGELMRDGRFFAFDVISFHGQDIRKEPLRFRLQILDSISVLRPAFGIGGEFLEAVLSRGGEGVVAKNLDGYFGDNWAKCKRAETLDLICSEKAVGKLSIRLRSVAGEDCGWCPCSAAFDSVTVGAVVEVSAYGIHRSGKLREPRFIRLRPDKQL